MRSAVRSDALLAAALAVEAVADGLRGDAAVVAGAVVGLGAPPVGGAALATGGVLDRGVLGGIAAWAGWARLEARVLGLAGPAGLWGEALALDGLGLRLRAAARLYEQVEREVGAVLRGVAEGVDEAGRAGWFVDGAGVGAGGTAFGPAVVDGSGRPVGRPVLRPVAARWAASRVDHLAELVSAGDDLGEGRVRVVETEAPGGGSAWVVVVPGTQEWSPAAGPNPFDLTTDVRAVTGDATVAAAGVAGALELARSRSPRAGAADPVLLVGHSQGGILAAALAADPAFRARHRVTHVVTSGAPVGGFPVPPSVRVLSVQHADDPVHRLDLGPNPSRSSWVTVQVPAERPQVPLDVRRHGLGEYAATVAVVEGAPRGTVAGFDGWRASAGDFVGVPVRSVTEVTVERGPP